MKSSFYLKICGLTQADQAQAIAGLGVSALGFIAVPDTPRYVTLDRMQFIVATLPTTVEKVGVFLDQDSQFIIDLVQSVGLTSVQLHGQESPDFCKQISQSLPGISLIKAFRIRDAIDLAMITPYSEIVDRILLDAYHPRQAGGTGLSLNWSMLRSFQAPVPWILAGGLKPETIDQALAEASPDGIDLSSGVERKPGDKDVLRVQQLIETIKSLGWNLDSTLDSAI